MLRSYADKLACIAKDKQRNDNNNDDVVNNDDWDVASGDDCQGQPLLLQIQSHPSSSSLNSITDNLILLLISC